MNFGLRRLLEVPLFCLQTKNFAKQNRRLPVCATCPKEFHSSLCSPAKFLAAAANLSSSTAIVLDKYTYPTLKHLPRCGMDFLLHTFNLSWSLRSFNLGRHLLFPSIRWESLWTLLLPSSLSLSSAASQSCLNASFYRVYSFWNLTPFSFPTRPASTLDGQLLMKFFIFLSSFRMGLINPSLALR